MLTCVYSVVISKAAFHDVRTKQPVFSFVSVLFPGIPGAFLKSLFYLKISDGM